MTRSKRHGIALAAIFALAAFLAGGATAQGPPPPGPPKTSPPRPKPSDAAKRAKTKQRKNSTSKGDGSGPRSGGSPGPAPEPKRARRPGGAEVKRAERLLGSMAGVARRLRDESWSGKAVLIDRLGTRSTIPVRVRRVWRGGVCRALIVHGRPGDLPDVAHLFEIDAKGQSRGWTLKSEDGKVVERGGVDDRIGRSALAFSDLVGYGLAHHAVAYEEATILDGKKAMRFAGAPKAKRPHGRAVFDIRGDHKLVGRVRLHRAGKEPWREIRFTDVKHVGVFRRWHSAVIQDHERSATALIEVKSRRVNGGLDFDAFVATALPDLLKP